ncbi:MAG: hypothetical protein M3160_05450 [Candidatus Eremiobacteraeota bacterium]|nr:hypothetical protein [Candidatus Eremiobacteraeota bacterium]
MVKRLEELEPGTPVYCGERHVGEVRGVFAEGSSQLAEYLNVYWSPRSLEVLVATDDVCAIDERGVILQGTVQRYDDLLIFDAAAHPTMRRLH